LPGKEIFGFSPEILSFLLFKSTRFLVRRLFSLKAPLTEVAPTRAEIVLNA
jgi:hypothetical protein